MDKKDIKLSSNLTFIYKYIITTFFYLTSIVLICSLFFDFNFLNIYMAARVLLSFFSLIFCLTVIPLTRLHFISYNESYTVIKGCRSKKKVSNKDIVVVKRFMFYFYRVFYKENGSVKKAIFMPNIIDVFCKFWSKPKSIKKYELNINSSANRS